MANFTGWIHGEHKFCKEENTTSVSVKNLVSFALFTWLAISWFTLIKYSLDPSWEISHLPCRIQILNYLHQCWLVLPLTSKLRLAYFMPHWGRSFFYPTGFLNLIRFDFFQWVLAKKARGVVEKKKKRKKPFSQSWGWRVNWNVKELPWTEFFLTF